MADQSLTTTLAPLPAAGPLFGLPPLPYGPGELKPVVSAETLQIHHGKHHARYVETLNRLLSDRPDAPCALEDVVRSAHADREGALFNNAAQAWNHAFFWESMRPKTSRPGGLLAGAIASAFGDVEALGRRFIAEGTGHFGSGWVWLIARGDTLDVVSTHDAGSPIVEDGVTPLLTCDVWEHAYYIDHRQDRAGWLTIWWSMLANWHFADRQYGAALGHGEPWRYPAARAGSAK